MKKFKEYYNFPYADLTSKPMADLNASKFSNDMINKLKKTYEPLKGKKINPTPLMKVFDKIDSNKDGLIQLYKADIPFVSMMAMSRLMLKHNYKASDINKLGKIRKEDFVEEVELDEASARDDAMRAMRRGRRVDPADVDEPSATDADKKGADKNIIMQMRKAMDVKGNMPIEFANGKKEKVDPKILDMMTKAHMKIQKPRDKEKFVAMISKSKRDMLNVAKKLGTLKAELDKDDVDTVMDVVKGLEKAVKTHQGQVATLKKDIKDENELDEGFSPKEIKMAIGVASDPRYKGGNYTGAFKAIEKIKKGLASHPQVAAVLKRQNENLEEGAMKRVISDVEDAMGPTKIRYKLKQKGGKFIVSVDSNDEEDAQKALKMHPLYVAGKLRVVPEELTNEENDMTKSLKDTIVGMWSEASKSEEGFASDAQRKAAFASGYKEKGKKKDKEEGNEFSGNLNKARKDGKKTFKVGDKEYPVKPAKKESVERYLETKQGSLRDAVLQMWGEKHTPGHDEEEKNEKKTLTKEKKDGIKKMTDTGKEVTPVETSVKMPKIKETKNKV